MAFRSDRHLATLISATAQRLEAFSLTSSRCAAHIMARATIRTRSLRSRIYGRNRNSRNFRSWVLAKWLGPYMAERVSISEQTRRQRDVGVRRADEASGSPEAQTQGRLILSAIFEGDLPRFVAQRLLRAAFYAEPDRWWLSQVAERTPEPVAETMVAAPQQLSRYGGYSLNATLG
jgi:hypothetical protein